MSSCFSAVTRVRLPAHLSPQAVVAALHEYHALMEASPHHLSHERRAVAIDEIVGDPFFRDNGHRLQAFIVHQRIPIIPGVGSWASKDLVVPCIFQSFEQGARCRAAAQGNVTVRSSYEVRRRAEVPGDGNGGTEVPVGPLDGPYEVAEIATVECPALVKPFVKMTFASSHLEVLQNFVARLAQAPPTQQQPPTAQY